METSDAAHTGCGPDEALRLAVIGCGAMAEFNHLPALERIGWGPSVLVDPRIDRAAELAAPLGARPAASIAAILDEFDTAVLALPHHLHASIAVSLLAEGKTVLVEKPLATDVASCEAMIAAAHAAPAPGLGVGLMRRYLDAGRWAAALIRSGRLGKILRFDARDGFVFDWMVTSDAIWKKESAGGGVLMDLGPHILDQLAWWLGPLDLVSYHDDAAGGVEADCIVELRTANEAPGVVELSRTRELRRSVVIVGELGRIEVGTDTNVLNAEPKRLLNEKFNGVAGHALAAQHYPDLFEAQLRAWQRSTRHATMYDVPGSIALPTMQLIAACYARRAPLVLPWSIGDVV